jgi:hypothetical protein
LTILAKLFFGCSLLKLIVGYYSGFYYFSTFIFTHAIFGYEEFQELVKQITKLFFHRSDFNVGEFCISKYCSGILYIPTKI